MIRRPPRSTLDRSSAASDVYKRQLRQCEEDLLAELVVGVAIGSDEPLEDFIASPAARLADPERRLLPHGERLAARDELLEQSIRSGPGVLRDGVERLAAELLTRVVGAQAGLRILCGDEPAQVL